MNPALIHSIGDIIAPFTSVVPQSSATAIVNGTSLDRLLHNMPRSCLLHQALGAVSGSPSAISVSSGLQHSADNATWASYIPGASIGQASTAALTAGSTENSVSVDLGSAMRYIRVVTTISFTGGTSPAVIVAAEIVIAGEDALAAI